MVLVPVWDESEGMPIVYPTAEVRWFGRGAVPAAVASWFRRFEHPPVEEPLRVDRYLRQVGTDSISVKVREGRLEVKQRGRAYGLLRFHKQVVGCVHLWRKWSFALAPDLVSRAALAEPHWIAVEKRRSLHRYRVDGEKVVLLGEADVAEEGCDLELARVRVGEVAWWTVGLEAYGDETSLEDTLVLVTGIALGPNDVPLLPEEDSLAYPKWLHQVGQESRTRPAIGTIPEFE